MFGSFIPNVAYLTNWVSNNIIIVKIRSGRKSVMGTNPKEEYKFCESFEFPDPNARKRLWYRWVEKVAD